LICKQVRGVKCRMQGYTADNSLQAQLAGHFGLRENPFGVTPDPRFLFHTETHREALASLINGIDCEFGFQVLLAQPGMGKTTLLFNLLERYHAAAHTAFLFQPLQEPRELLQAILLELGSGSEETSLSKLSERLNNVLGQAAQERKRVIVIVDEAQNLDFAVLEALRQLSNFETAHKKLMQIVLAGQPQLAKKLGSPEQQQLLQRISFIARLSPLALNEARAYIQHRLQTAGYRGGDLFTAGAVWNIWDRSQGVPRNINTLCFNAMLLAFAEQARSIDERILAEASRDLDLTCAMHDLYQKDASAAGAGGRGKVQPIRETRPPETNSTRLGTAERAEVVGDVSLPLPETTLRSVAPSDKNVSGGLGSIPPELVDAIARINQALEEQKILLVSKSAPAARAPSAEVLARSNEESLQRPATQIRGGTRPAVQGESTAKAGKSSAPAVQKIDSPARGSATAVAAHPPRVFEQKSYVSGTVMAQSRGPVAGKKSKTGGSLLKALLFAASTAILAVALVERVPLQRLGKLQAKALGLPAYLMGDSETGSPQDTPERSVPNNPSGTSSGNVNSNSRPARYTPPDQEEVIVRNFPQVSPSAIAGRGSQQLVTSIFFEQDSAVIRWQYRSALQQIADALAQNPQANAVLEGHTDNTGPEAYNLDLSSRRAIAVQNSLVNELHIPRERLTAIGAGSAAPVQPNSSPTGRAYNRRVEARLVPADVP
jgi:type II secretory pathway predicted ATPase ExeA/outer membrane protein OmpA-like peptidoglycan-associated protein